MNKNGLKAMERLFYGVRKLVAPTLLSGFQSAVQITNMGMLGQVDW